MPASNDFTDCLMLKNSGEKCQLIGHFIIQHIKKLIGLAQFNETLYLLILSEDIPDIDDETIIIEDIHYSIHHRFIDSNQFTNLVLKKIR